VLSLSPLLFCAAPVWKQKRGGVTYAYDVSLVQKE